MGSERKGSDKWARKGSEIGGTVHFFIGMYSLARCVQVVPGYVQAAGGGEVPTYYLHLYLLMVRASGI